MKLAVHGRPLKTEALPSVSKLFELLGQAGGMVKVYAPFAESLLNSGIDTSFCMEYDDRADLPGTDIILSIGGDGTLLETLTWSGPHEIPILGINAGRLGFLATTPGDGIEKAIGQIFSGEYFIEDRSLLRLEAGIDLFDGRPFALNEFTITKRETSSMILVHTYLNGEFLNSYWADGLIVSTPTGATGYSLSCGGPLVMPDVGNFVISPVSPHNLSVRPIVVSDNSVLSFQIEGRSNRFLVSLDSRSATIKAGTSLSVRKEKFKAKLVRFTGDSYLKTLRSKLNWGLDVRN